MKPANLKVKTRLERFGLEFEIRILPNAVRTAALAAEALDCAVGQIANSLIFRDKAGTQAVLVMCAGDRRVDLQKVKLETGIELGKADADFVRQQTGFAIGGVPPVAHTRPLRTLLDDSLQRHMAIWAAAGTPESVFCMSPQQLQLITAGSWLDIAQS
jgi:prolyl-tRNA editing enzyme YbaK/EbsC (Cys-tRNA(Pro) deacylase)